MYIACMQYPRGQGPKNLIHELYIGMVHPQLFLTAEISCATLYIYRVIDQLSDGLIFGRLFQANERLSAFRSCTNL